MSWHPRRRRPSRGTSSEDSLWGCEIVARGQLDVSNVLRKHAAIEFPIIRGGIHVDTIVDTIPVPDVLHFIQTSHAFAEKALKFLVCLQDPTMVLEDIRPFGHDLGALIAHYRTIEPELFRRLESGGLADTLDAIANIDFVRLRYLEAHRATSEVNWTKLSRLNRELMEQVKAKRFTYYYSNEETRRRVSETTARISIQCPFWRNPGQPSVRPACIACAQGRIWLGTRSPQSTVPIGRSARHFRYEKTLALSGDLPSFRSFEGPEW